ncbi:hypothetical protein AMA1_42 [Achromobacter phage AMA1]|nr:hypothetical protein AMA1_42 [Achromobacter phage AMA1]
MSAPLHPYIAQAGSASALGAEGRRFESYCTDQKCWFQEVKLGTIISYHLAVIHKRSAMPLPQPDGCGLRARTRSPPSHRVSCSGCPPSAQPTAIDVTVTPP